MFFLPEILLLCLVIFLYCLFALAKDDFILLRKNVSLEQLFSMSFLGFIVALFFARIVYVIEHLSKKYLDPLVFFLFPYFPGLSIVGGILGGLLLIWYFSSKRKFPFGRVFDIISAAFFFTFSVGMFLFAVAQTIVTKKPLFLLFGADFVFFLFSLFYYRLFIKSSFKDGSIGFIGFSLFSLLNIILILVGRGKDFLRISIEESIFFVCIFLFAALFIQQEKLSAFLTGGKKK